MTLAQTLAWPEGEAPVDGDTVVLASQGVRIWTAACPVLSSYGTLTLRCDDTTTLENLSHQRRVAFTVLKKGMPAAHGTAMASLSHDTSGRPSIALEPYRLSVGDAVYELRIGGWQTIDNTIVDRQSRLSFWYHAFRAVTLPLSALPVIIGTAVAFVHGSLDVPLFLLALVGAMLAHAGANAMADYFDFKNGVDLSTALSSHLGALARERVAPEFILIAAFSCLMITAFIGLVLVQMVGWTLVIFGLAGLAGAFFYTGRPLSYKYRGLGELTLGMLMGPVIVMGSYYVQTRSWAWDAFALSLALALLVSSISLANNLRDIPDDRAAGISTLPMMIGTSASKRLYYVLTAGPYALAGVSILLDPDLWPLAITLLSVPQAVRTIGDLHATSDDTDNIRQRSLKHPFPLNSIRLHFRFGSLAILGLVLTRVIQMMLQRLA